MTGGTGSSAAADVSFGIDIGGTKVLGVALGPLDTIVAEARLTPPSAPAHPDLVGAAGDTGVEVAYAIADVVAQLDAAGAPFSVRRGRVRHRVRREWTMTTPRPPWASGRPACSTARAGCASRPISPRPTGSTGGWLIGDRLPGRRIVVENDANLAVLAEHRLGAARGYRHVVMVTLGTGIGGGVVIDGRVQVGGHGFAGEIGHMVVDPAGPALPLRAPGLLGAVRIGRWIGADGPEAALAGRLPAVVALAGGDPEGVRGEDVTAAALAGDPDARRVSSRSDGGSVSGWPTWPACSTPSASSSVAGGRRR